MKITELNSIINSEIENYKTCSHCGLTSPEVITRTCYIGGKGNVPVDECWVRFDANNLKARLLQEVK